MKSTNPFYKLITILLSAVLVSVFAQQPPRIQSTVDSELSRICGEKSSPYAERVRLIHRLPSNLAPEQLERCRAFLKSPLAGQPLPDLEFNGLKNECVFSNSNLISKTLFVYDGFKCVEELDALKNNAVSMRHTWQQFVCGKETMLSTTDDTAISYLIYDANKNVRQKSNINGTLLNTYVYSPFGDSIGQIQTHFGFSSEIRDETINIDYYNYRYYSCEWGRWLRRDFIKTNRNINEYIFINNDGVNSIDILGLMRPSDFYGYSDQKKKKWIDNFWKNFGLYILQSATKNCVPYRLLAGVVANEQLDYSWVENILEHFGMGNSLGPAQISVPTAISEGMIDLTPDAFQDLWSIGINGEVIFTSKYEMFNLYVRAKLLSIESNIDIAARLLRKNLNFLCDNFASGNISQSFFNDIMRGNPGAYYSLKKFCCQYKKGECNPKIIGTLPNAMAAMWNNGKNIIFVDDILHKSPNAYNHSRHAEEIYYYVERIHH